MHRIPGGSRQAVWADPAELTRWLKAAPAEIHAELQRESGLPPPATTAGGDAHGAIRRRPWAWRAGAAGIALLIGAVTVASLRVTHAPDPAARRDPAAAYDDDPAARHTYEVAAFELSERTATSLSAAEGGFRGLANRYPDRAPAWSGLAEAYILEREFGALSDEVAFSEAAHADSTALALDPGSASAWLDKGYIAWWWKGDADAAFSAFEKAIALDPTRARAWHWYATALENHGDFARSVQTIAQARRLDPENRATMADEAVIQFDAGLREQGLATLERLSQLDPQFVSWHQYLTHAYLLMGRDADYLRESITVARLRGQEDLLAELQEVQRRQEGGGRPAMLDALSTLEAKRMADGSGAAIRVAMFRALANDKPGMLHWLEVARQRHEHGLASLQAYIEFTAFHEDPDFQAFSRTLPRPGAGT